MREDFLERLEGLSPEDFTRIFRSFGTMKNNILLDKIKGEREERYIRENLGRFSLEDLVQIFASYSQTGAEMALVEGVLGRLRELGSRLDFFQLILVNWSLRVLDGFDAELFREFVQRLRAQELGSLSLMNSKYLI